MEEPNTPRARPSSQVEWLVEAAALGILLFWVYYLATHWSTLPDEVPRTFGFNGKPGALGSKSVLWVITGIGVLVYFSMTLLSRLPRLHNFPVDVTPENAPDLYAFSRKLLNLAKLEVIAALGYIEWKMLQTARGNAERLAPWFIGSLVAVMFLTSLYPVYRLRR